MRKARHRFATQSHASEVFSPGTPTFGGVSSLLCQHDSQHAQVHPAARAQPREHAVSRAEEAVEIFPLQRLWPGRKPPPQRVRVGRGLEHWERRRRGDAHHPRAVPPLHRIQAASGAFQSNNPRRSMTICFR